jgi:hypothetical protein
MLDLSKPLAFEWDEGNLRKNETKHSVSNNECEEVFNNQPLIVTFDFIHSQSENRYHALGKTFYHRELHITFTIRENKIRVISARAMSKKERRDYETDSSL